MISAGWYSIFALNALVSVIIAVCSDAPLVAVVNGSVAVMALYFGDEAQELGV